MGKSKTTTTTTATTTTTTTTTTSTTPTPPGQLNITNTTTHAASTHTPSAVRIIHAKENLCNMPENTDKETIDRSGHFYFAKGRSEIKRKVLFSFNSDKKVITFTTDFDYKYTTQNLASALGKTINTEQMGKVTFKSSTIKSQPGNEILPVLEMRSIIKDKEPANKLLLNVLTDILRKRKHEVVLSTTASLEMNNSEEINTLLTEEEMDSFIRFIQPESLHNIHSSFDEFQSEKQGLQAEKQNEETSQPSQPTGSQTFFPFLMGGVQFLFSGDNDSQEKESNSKKRKDKLDDNSAVENEDTTEKQRTKQQKTVEGNPAQVKNKIITLATGDRISNIFKMQNGKEILCEIENDKVKFTALNPGVNYSRNILCAVLKKRFKNSELFKFVTFTVKGAEGGFSCYMKLNEKQPTITLHKALKEFVSVYEPVNMADDNGPEEPDNLEEVNIIDTVNATEILESNISIFDAENNFLLEEILKSPSIGAEIATQSQNLYSPHNFTLFGLPSEKPTNSETPEASNQNNKLI